MATTKIIVNRILNNLLSMKYKSDSKTNRFLDTTYPEDLYNLIRFEKGRILKDKIQRLSIEKLDTLSKLYHESREFQSDIQSYTVRDGGADPVLDLINRIINLPKKQMDRFARPNIYFFVSKGLLTLEEIIDMPQEELLKLSLPDLWLYISKSKITFERLRNLSMEQLKKLAMPEIWIFVVDGRMTIDDVLVRSKEELKKLALSGLSSESGVVRIEEAFVMSEDNLKKISYPNIRKYIQEGKLSLEQVLSMDLERVEKLAAYNLSLYLYPRVISGQTYRAPYTMPELLELSDDTLFRMGLISETEMRCMHISKKMILEEPVGYLNFLKFCVSLGWGILPSNPSLIISSSQLKQAYKVCRDLGAAKKVVPGAAKKVVPRPDVITMQLVDDFVAFRSLEELATKLGKEKFNDGVGRFKIGVIINNYKLENPRRFFTFLSKILKHPLAAEFAIAIASQPQMLATLESSPYHSFTHSENFHLLMKFVSCHEIEHLKLYHTLHEINRVGLVTDVTHILINNQLLGFMTSSTLNTLPGVKIPVVSKRLDLDSEEAKCIIKTMREEAKIILNKLSLSKPKQVLLTQPSQPLELRALALHGGGGGGGEVGGGIAPVPRPRAS